MPETQIPLEAPWRLLLDPEEKEQRRLVAMLLIEREGWLAEARPRLVRLARLRGVAPDAVEDVVQETLLEAWTHLDRLYAPEGFHRWIDEICRNVCRRYARAQQSETARAAALFGSAEPEYEETASSEAPALLANLGTPAPDMLEALNQQDLTALLHRAVSALPGSMREAVELSYLQEWPQRKVATHLGLSMSALEARLHRARGQMRQLLNGPLRAEAEAFGMALDEDPAFSPRETRLWCNLCGQRRLRGSFVQQPDGSVNLHLDCPDCMARYGIGQVHSKGIVQLDGIRSFRPAWKRTMQTVTHLARKGLTQGWHPCPTCGTPASVRVVNRHAEGVLKGPYQFWVDWHCPQCTGDTCPAPGTVSADDVVYWSHPTLRQFILQHARWVSEPDRAVEFGGHPAIQFHLVDVSSRTGLTILAHQQTLDVLAIFEK
ncbi:MAG TPA: sigma-70 family RNA polymerase sigma factor [Ktedonobacterales bacterium]|jgi:RNA polymerase sigma-70 factor (ECF subfamily)